MPGRKAAFSVCHVYSCASRTASAIASPLAMVAAMADGERAARAVKAARQALPGVAAHHALRAVESVLTTCGVFSCVPVTSTYSQPSSSMRRAHSARSGSSLSSSPSVGEAPRLEAVRRDHRGLRHEQLAHRHHHLVRRELVAAPEASTGSSTAGCPDSRRRPRRSAAIALDAAEHADLEHGDRHVLEHAARLVGHPLASSGITSSTPVVSWTVIAVTTDSGWQPMLASVRMSACSPAPPLGSVAAKTRTIGGVGEGTMVPRDGGTDGTIW